MNEIAAIDVLCWTAIGGAILLVLGLFVWSLCSIAKLSDESADKYWESQMEGQEDNIEDIIETV